MAMDIRGIEVTNQLRSAIRAKLLELGVRYDEELPDYILVMVVNKKSRQQMQEDLYLFLEDCTKPFVDWLHDQVLKKLQKVTVAKKKKEFVPVVIVKQEEDKKKKKSSLTTSFLEDHDTGEGDKLGGKSVKEDKSSHKQDTKSPVATQSTDMGNKNSSSRSGKAINDNKSEDSHSRHSESASKKAQQTDGQNSNVAKEGSPVTPASEKAGDSRKDAKTNDISKTLKRSLDAGNDEGSEKKSNETKRSRVSEDDDSAEDSTKKLKSCVNKPKITSVVSVKNRLDVNSPRKKFEIYREKGDDERYRQSERHRFDGNRNCSPQRGRNFEMDDRLRKTREIESKHELDKPIDIRSRLGISKGERPDPIVERENPRSKINEKPTGTIKDRLGIANNKLQKQDMRVTETSSRSSEQDRGVAAKSTKDSKNIKDRLGPLKNNSRMGFNRKRSQSSEDEDCLNLSAEEELDDDMQSVANASSVKSHIIAVRRPSPPETIKRRLPPENQPQEAFGNTDDEEMEDQKLPSKVIVTPRPLKPLQPSQKRATQSLLLRAVAEANQSVVKQKNPDPISLLDKKMAMKRLKPASTRDITQNLSVHLNASKRLVMEKIQVELNTTDAGKTESKSHVPQAVTEEQMGVVMSLFQRSDDNQKFLVTLNGYSNNLPKEKIVSDDEERLEMEVNEEDELALLANQNDCVQNESEQAFRINDSGEETETKERSEENNENCNTENVDSKTEEAPRKKRKLSPIVYNRSHSPSPPDLKSSTIVPTTIVTKRLDKRPLAETIVEKSRERCRYWPNCTLGNKCSYLHPAVMCSAFPACKFGDKCAYKHPKCKFGLSCTKLGCVFSHPAQQCKYHPFCTKPGCPYSHPMPHTALTVEATTQRAKFTWRRRD